MTKLPHSQRVFKIGAVRIVEDESMRDRNNEQIRELLKPTYPEVTHATIREHQDGDTIYVEFLPQPGRKG